MSKEEKEARKKYIKNWKNKNKEKHKKYCKKWDSKNPEKVRYKKYKYKYGEWAETAMALCEFNRVLKEKKYR